MKKSSIILMHVIFWVVVILVSNYTLWVGQFNGGDFFGIGSPKNSFFATLAHTAGSIFEPGNVYYSGWDKFLIIFRPLSVCIPVLIFYLYYLRFAPGSFTSNSKKTIIWSLGFITVFPMIGGLVFVCAWWSLDIPFSKYFFISYVISIAAAALGSLFYLLIDWNKRRMNAVKERRVKIEGELALLKNQVSPHLLFNTLNNIDSLIMTSPEKASAMVVSLGSILRYTIYESEAKYVELDRELSFIKDYIELQNIQYSCPNMICFKVHDSLEGFSIPPMILIPFVENAFKHCTAKNYPGAIFIEAGIEDGNLNFLVENSCNKKEDIAKDPSSGIGIANVKRRLELLYSPDCYHLKIARDSMKYKVELKVCLNEN